MFLRFRALVLVVVIGGFAVSRLVGGGGAFKTYQGATAQGMPMLFQANGNTVKDITFGWRATCADGQVRSNVITGGHGTVRSGTITSGETISNTGGSITLNGTIQGKVASGNVTRSGPTTFGVVCNMVDDTWTATTTG
jgi:hypothetical protein